MNQISIAQPPCPKCKEGTLYPIPTSNGMPFGKWVCTKCKHEVTRKKEKENKNKVI